MLYQSLSACDDELFISRFRRGREVIRDDLEELGGSQQFERGLEVVPKLRRMPTVQGKQEVFESFGAESVRRKLQSMLCRLEASSFNGVSEV